MLNIDKPICENIAHQQKKTILITKTIFLLDHPGKGLDHPGKGYT